jgi:cell division protease FtsH
VHAKHIKMAPDTDLRKIAALTPGSVGADLANIINEAALLAARSGKAQVGMADFNEAVERGALGLERKSRIMKADEKRRVAIHESGHALVAVACPHSDPVHKVSIIPRGYGALGFMLRRPEDDRHIHTRGELETNIKICLGGTLAEETIFGDFATGAMSDLEKANQIARRMVKVFGMSKLGRIYVREGEENSFLPSIFTDGVRDCSEETAREIDLEVRQIIDNATEEVRSIIQRNRVPLEMLATKLVEKEVIDGAELHELLRTAGLVTDFPTTPVEANGVSTEHGNIPH